MRRSCGKAGRCSAGETVVLDRTERLWCASIQRTATAAIDAMEEFIRYIPVKQIK